MNKTNVGFGQALRFSTYMILAAFCLEQVLYNSCVGENGSELLFLLPHTPGAEIQNVLGCEHSRISFTLQTLLFYFRFFFFSFFLVFRDRVSL